MNNKKTKVTQCLTILVGLILATLLGTSCKKSNTYADYVDDQKDEISSFLSKNKISVTGTMPEDSTEWKDGDNDVCIVIHHPFDLEFPGCFRFRYL